VGKPKREHCCQRDFDPIEKGSFVRRLTQTKRLAVAVPVTIALSVSAVAAYAGAGSGPGSQSTPIQQLAETPGPGGLARANGLNPGAAIFAFPLRNGDTVSVVANATAKCLIRARGGVTAGETCNTLPAIDEGAAIDVTDECGTSGRNLMEVTGLAPEGVSAVHLNSSDGSHQTAAVVNGAFKFDGTNPSTGAPYPTGVSWLTGTGAVAAGAALPVHGNQFCIPTP
jgi:hypothetical protein